MKCFLCLLTMLALLSVSCSLKQMPHYGIDANIKAAFNYKPGTYWIYKDSVSGRVDSFYVASNKFTPSFQGNDFNADVIDIVIIEKNTNPFSTSITDNILYYYGIETNRVCIQYSIGYTTMYYLPLFSYPFSPGYFIDQYGNPVSSGPGNYCMQVYPSYSVYGQNFSNVAEIQMGEYPLSTPGASVDTFYLNSDIGIIKMRLNHPYDSLGSKLWQLQRWNIVK